MRGYVRELRSAARNPPRDATTEEKGRLTAINNYVGSENDGTGPVIEASELSGTKQASSDQAGTIKIDVKKVENGNFSKVNGAMSIAHEAQHELDSADRGAATTETEVRTREERAYGIQDVVGRAHGLVTPASSLRAGIEGSVQGWLDRQKKDDEL